MCAALSEKGHIVESVASGQELCACLDVRVPEVVLLDLSLGDESAADIVSVIQDMGEFISVVVVTDSQDVALIAEVLRRGADSFLPKPFDLGRLCEQVESALVGHRLKRRALVYQSRLDKRSPKALTTFVGSNEAVTVVRSLVEQVATTDSLVMIRGETGTGKGVIAHSIHQLSQRASSSFVAVNCASIQPQLLESEIFGHEKGAFTDASVRKPGLMEIADGGTFFLDEIAELEPSAQGKLLTALETNSFRRVGGVREISVNTRLIAATHHDLEAEVDAGKFRSDLFYRLNVFQIELPPLRKRVDDIMELVRHFITTLNPALNRSIEGVSPEAASLLTAYQWPGNVRELRNVVERAMILTKGNELLATSLPSNLQSKDGAEYAHLPSLAEVEREHIKLVLAVVDNNIQLASSILGVSRSTLYTKIKQYQ